MRSWRFHKPWWLLHVATVVVCAIFGARIVNDLLAASLLTESAAPTPLPRRTAVAPPPPAAKRSKDGADLIARNMFCSTCSPEADAPASPETPVDDSGVPPITQLPLELVATNLSAAEERSFATVRNTSLSTAGAYGIGDRLPGAGPIVAIRARYVDFQNPATTRVERVSLDGRASVRPGQPPKPGGGRDPGSARPRDPLQAELDEGIRRIDDTHYEVDRELISKMVADPRMLRGVRVRPSISDGKTDGWTVAGVTGTSPAARVGLQSGDKVTAVNGYALSSPDKLFEIYSNISSASSVSVEVVRRGKPVTLSYTLR